MRMRTCHERSCTCTYGMDYFHNDQCGHTHLSCDNRARPVDLARALVAHALNNAEGAVMAHVH